MAEVSTPPPPGRVHTPQSPKHGFHDSWVPYTPRKSARISQRAHSNRTPSPPRSSTRSARHADALASTPAISPLKKRLPAKDSVRRSSGALTVESAASAADHLGIGSKSQQKPRTSAAAATRDSTMLPTPSKTPRKQADEKTASASRAVARNLFPTAADSPSKKRTKRHSGLGLDAMERADEPIQIFTDSRDRIPEVDNTEENPFNAESSSAVVMPEPTKRRTSKRKTTIHIPGEGRVDLEEAIKRDDGFVYVFRGKKVWKPTGSGNPADQLDVEGALAEDATDVEVHDETSSRRVTRSSMKPRLLFPPKSKGKGLAGVTTDDEEAATDIEDHVLEGITEESEEEDEGKEETAEDAVEGAAKDSKLDTPKDAETPGTPDAPRFAPASPPTTARTTRMSKRLQLESPRKQPAKARSPFDGWRRSKNQGATQRHKREAGPLPGETSSKRQRA